MGWIILISMAIIFIFIVTGTMGSAKEEKKKPKPAPVQKKEVINEEQPYNDKVNELIRKFKDIAIETLTANKAITREERADLILSVIDSLDENAPYLSEEIQKEIVLESYQKLHDRYTMLKDADSVQFIENRIVETKAKPEMTTEDYITIIDFMELHTSVKVIYSSDEEKLKKQYFETFLEEYKDHTVDQLQQLIEDNRKDNYADYTTEDKQKFRAMKTLIERQTAN